jgi:hypothetical protein
LNWVLAAEVFAVEGFLQILKLAFKRDNRVVIKEPDAIQA